MKKKLRKIEIQLLKWKKDVKGKIKKHRNKSKTIQKRKNNNLRKIKYRYKI